MQQHIGRRTMAKYNDGFGRWVPQDPLSEQVAGSIDKELGNSFNSLCVVLRPSASLSIITSSPFMAHVGDSWPDRNENRSVMLLDTTLQR